MHAAARYGDLVGNDVTYLLSNIIFVSSHFCARTRSNALRYWGGGCFLLRSVMDAEFALHIISRFTPHVVRCFSPVMMSVKNNEPRWVWVLIAVTVMSRSGLLLFYSKQSVAATMEEKEKKLCVGVLLAAGCLCSVIGASFGTTAKKTTRKRGVHHAAT